MEVLSAAEHCAVLDPSTPKGHRMVGYLRREAADLQGARDAYQMASDLGDSEGAVEMFGIAHEMGDSAWIRDNAKAIDKWQLTEEQEVEIRIIEIAASAARDRGLDTGAALDKLPLDHPNNAYIMETINNNRKT